MTSASYTPLQFFVDLQMLDSASILDVLQEDRCSVPGCHRDGIHVGMVPNFSVFSLIVICRHHHDVGNIDMSDIYSFNFDANGAEALVNAVRAVREAGEVVVASTQQGGRHAH